MARSRLAVALLITEPHRTEIDGLRRALGSRGLTRIPPHVTLIPPVNVNDERLPDAFDVVAAAAAAAPPMRLTLGPPASFWPDNPTVYLAVGGDISVVRSLRDALSVPPIERGDTRQFVPHVTIAEHVGTSLIGSALELLASYRAEVTVERVHLLRHRPERSWDVIGDAACGGPRTVGRGGLEVILSSGDVLDPEAAAFFARTWQAHIDASYGHLPAPRPFAVVARREGSVVGVATGSRDDELLLERLAVDPAVQGQGIGRHLLREVEGLARDADRALLVCQAEGPARSWYEAHGWSVVLALPAWRHGRDFVRMARGG